MVKMSKQARPGQAGRQYPSIVQQKNQRTAEEENHLTYASYIYVLYVYIHTYTTPFPFPFFSLVESGEKKEISHRTREEGKWNEQ